MLNLASFGKYRLVAKIAAGSLGEVYRAQPIDSPQSPEVALKRLLTGRVGDVEYAAVFTKEIDISRQMQHPRLLGAIDSGSISGWPFLVCPLAEQGSLGDRLENNAVLPRQELAVLAEDLGDALDAMHQFGYSHGDLNPGNVVFHKGRAHLIDFSAGTVIGQKQPHPLGSYAYMSPEQVRGQALDARSDVFTCAALLWQCVCGVQVFGRGEQHLTFMAVVEEEPDSMSEKFAEVEAVLRRGLSKEPTGRPATVSQLCTEFVSKL